MRVPGIRIGEDGGEYRTRAIGEIEVCDASIFAAVKLPKGRADPILKTQTELSGIELLLSRIPELTPQVPQFMGLIAVEGGKPRAILTEDASRGGQEEVQALWSNMELAERVEAAFSRKEDFDYEVDDESIEQILSFMVGGQQRLLDFTPPPVRNLGTDDVFDQRADEVLLEGRDLVIDLPASSPLAQAIA